jgi:WD40 repeat protein
VKRRRFGAAFRVFLAGPLLVAAARSAEESGVAEADAIPIVEPKRSTPVDFQVEVLPILARSCLACHNAGDAKAKLVLETPATILAGGRKGPAAVAGNGADSLVLRVASHRAKPFMPPRSNQVGATALKPDELGLLRMWIDQGARGTAARWSAPKWHALPPGLKPIYAVALSPDGQLAAASRANQVLIYQLATGRLEMRLTDPDILKTGLYPPPGAAHLDSVQSLAFDPSGDLLASAAFREVKIWRRARDELPLELQAAAGDVQTLAASADGRWLAGGTAGGAIALWDLAGGKPAAAMLASPGAAIALEFSPDGARLASVSKDGSLRFFQVPDGAPAGRIDAPGPIGAVAYLAGGGRVATGGADGSIRLWAAPAGPARRIEGVPAPVSALAASPDGKLLVLGGADGRMSVVEVETGHVRWTSAGHLGAVSSLSFGPDAGRFASGGADGAVRVFDLAGGAPVAAAVPLGPTRIERVALDPRGEVVASGGADGKITLWKLDPKARELRADRDLPGLPQGVSGLLFAKDGILLAAWTDGSIRALGMDGSQKFAASHGAQVHDLALSLDGKWLASAGEDRKVRIWSAADGAPAPRPSLEGFSGPVRRVSFTSDGRKVIPGGDAARELAVVDLASGETEERFGEHDGAITALAAAGDSVVSASSEGGVRLWRPAALGRLAGHARAVTALAAVPPAGTRLISAAEDGSVKVWGLAESKAALEVSHGAAVAALAVSSDGKRLASVGGDQPAKLWSLADGKPVASMKGDYRAGGAVARLTELAGHQGGRTDGARNRLAGAEKEAAARAEASRKAGEALAAAEKTLSEKQDGAKKAAEAASVSNASADIKKASEAAARAAGEAEAARSKARTALEDAAAEAKRAGETMALEKARLATAGADEARTRAQLEAARAAAAAAERPARSLAFSADGRQLFIGGEDGNVRAFDAVSGAPVDVAPGAAGAVRAMACLPGGKLAVSSAGSKLSVRDPRLAFRLERTIGGADDGATFADRVTAVAFSPDGALLAAAGGEPSRSGQLKVWKVAGGLLWSKDDAHSDVIFGLEFSADGNSIATAGADKFVRVFTAGEGKPVRTFEGHSSHVLGVSWHVDGDVLASAGAEGLIKVWNLSSGEQQRSIGGFGKQVTSIHFVGASMNAVVSSGDRSVRLQRLDNGEGLRSFPGGSDYMYAAAITADGKTVAAGGHDGVLRVWSAADGKVVWTFGPE